MPIPMLKNLIATTILGVSFSTFAMSTQQAVDALNLNELAETYNQSQIEAITQNNNANKYDALMVTVGAINQDDLNNSQIVAHKLDNFVSDQQKRNENYLGNISDKNIVERINKSWDRAIFPSSSSTITLLNSFIDKGYTTGYNLIDTRLSSNFDEKRMIRYGHNDITHANQLIYLMKREGFDPKVQLTPKSSAFLYLEEWGEPEYPVQTLASGKKVAVVKEYNLDFEFRDEAEKNRFMALINRYAKKNSADQKGLIASSWWQPFYRSYSPISGYDLITENRVIDGFYQADLMALTENSQKQEQQIAPSDNSYRIEMKDIWVNPSFYRYLHGDYK